MRHGSGRARRRPSGSSGHSAAPRACLDDAAAGSATVLVFPTAVLGNWAEGCNCTESERPGIDDIGFVEAMPDTLATRWTLSPDQTFAVGYSQGGMFAHRAGCELSERFAATATVAATMSYALSLECRPARPVSAVIMHGTEDPIVPWGGGSSGLLSATGTAEFWAHQSDCDVEPAVESRDLGDGTAARTHEYQTCYQGRRISLVALVGYGHTWPRGRFDAAETIVDFFSGEGS